MIITFIYPVKQMKYIIYQENKITIKENESKNPLNVQNWNTTIAGPTLAIKEKYNESRNQKYK